MNDLQFPWKSGGISLLQFFKRPCVLFSDKSVLNILSNYFWSRVHADTRSCRWMSSSREKWSMQSGLSASCTLRQNSVMLKGLSSIGGSVDSLHSVFLVLCTKCIMVTSEFPRFSSAELVNLYSSLNFLLVYIWNVVDLFHFVSYRPCINLTSHGAPLYFLRYC
jgi:hypothetical protein